MSDIRSFFSGGAPPARVKCPVCGKMMLQAAIVRHVDDHFSTTRPIKRQGDAAESSRPKKRPARDLHPLMAAREVDSKRDLFADSEFPPTPQSIDGRKDENTTSRSGGSKPSAPPRCRCGAPARVCTVYKEGPNQGRLFWGCAKRDRTKRCSFFSWAKKAPHSKGTLALKWLRYRPPRFKLVRFVNGQPKFSASDIRQGSVGDCWFLSAVAVVAERRPDLIRDIFFSQNKIAARNTGSDGKYTVRLFIDGDWRSVLVDNFLPTKPKPKPKKSSSRPRRARTDAAPQPAYSKAAGNQIWVPILEKAYAKVHGSYRGISGGFIHEALLDLTGCPTESIEFNSPEFDSEATWARLLSFHEAGFPVGISTGRDPTLRGTGLVGSHAYSILDVREVYGVSTGKQLTINGCFGTSSSTVTSSTLPNRPPARPESDAELASRLQRQEFAAAIKSGNSNPAPKRHVATRALGKTTKGLRLVRIRNPWGRTEWSGAWGRESEKWTASLRDKLPMTSSNDGTFWMAYSDVLMRFGEIDVCKAHRGWTATGYRDAVQVRAGGAVKGFRSLRAERQYSVTAREPTWCHVMLLQPTKRGRGASGRYYADLALTVCEVNSGGSAADDVKMLHPEALLLSGAVRSSDTQVVFQPSVRYLVTPVALRTRSRGTQSPFMVRFFASKPSLNVQPVPFRHEVAARALEVCVSGSVRLPGLRYSTPIQCSNAKCIIQLVHGPGLALLVVTTTQAVLAGSRSQNGISICVRVNSMIPVTMDASTRLIRPGDPGDSNTESVWTCSACTFANSSGAAGTQGAGKWKRRKCAMCGKTRPVVVQVDVMGGRSPGSSIAAVFLSECLWAHSCNILTVDSSSQG